MLWQGVAFFTLADLVRPKASVTHVFFKSYDGYSTNNPIEACLDDDVLIAHQWNGQPLAVEHGGPARVIIPTRPIPGRTTAFRAEIPRIKVSELEVEIRVCFFCDVYVTSTTRL